MNLPINLNMKPQNIFIAFLILVIGVLLFTRGCDSQPVPVHVIDYKKTLDSLKSIATNYQLAFQEYEKKNDSLTKQLASTELLLLKEKTKLSPIRKKVKKVIRENWDTIPKETKLIKCDSLKDLVEEYETQIAITDSLTEQKINSLNLLIDVKDEQLKQCDSSYTQIEKLLEKSIDDNRTCSEDLKKTNRKLKRKQFFNRILGSTTGVAVVAVAALVIVGL